MSTRVYTIKFKPPETSEQTVDADEHAIVDGYLVLRRDEALAGLFLLEVVESWSYVDKDQSEQV